MPTSNIHSLLEVVHLNTGYGKRQVLFDVSFEVRRGEIAVIVGGNGSGKSTLLKAVYNLLPTFEHSSGSIFFDGENISKDRPYELITKGIVYVAQKGNTFDQLTVIENLELATAYLRERSEKQRRLTQVYERFPALAAIRKRTPFHLSGGERQQVALAMALVQQPKIMLLDEPGTGLAPGAWQNTLRTIRSLNQEGITFLIVEHRAKEMLKFASSIFLMKMGTIASVNEEGVVS